MCEAQVSGVQKRAVKSVDGGSQADAFDRVDFASVVSRVGDDRVIDVRQVDSDLVSAPGFDFDIQQSEFFQPLGDSVKRRSVPPNARWANSHSDAVARISANWCFYTAFVGFQHSINQSRVNFANLARLKLFSQMQMSVVGFGYDNQAGRADVQAMNYARARTAASTWKLQGLLLKVINQGVGQSAGSDACAGMRDHSGGFVNNNDFVVFVNNVKRNVFWLGFQRSGFRQCDLNLFARADFVSRLGDWLAVDKNLAEFDGSADLGATGCSDL